MTRILQIDSRDNPRVKEARRVRDGREDDKIFLEGVRLVREAIQSKLPIECLFLSNEGRTRAAGLVEAAHAADNFQLSNSAFESISDTVTSQGVIALAQRPPSGVARIGGLLSTATVPLVVFLSRTNNPSNLGAVARAVEAAGACGLIVSRGSADAFSPKALRASMGSSFRLPIWSEVDLGEALQWATKNDLQTVATQVGAERSYFETDWTKPTMLVLGSEASGLSEVELARIGERVSIPMESSVESLNLAVACGVIVFEARRQCLAV